MHQSREAHHPARPHHSPEGGHEPTSAELRQLLQVVADYTRVNAMKRGLRGGNLPGATVELTTRRPMAMLHAGLDLSRHRLDVCLLDMQAAPSRSPPRRRMPTGWVGWPARPLSTDSRYER